MSVSISSHEKMHFFLYKNVCIVFSRRLCEEPSARRAVKMKTENPFSERAGRRTNEKNQSKIAASVLGGPSPDTRR